MKNKKKPRKKKEERRKKNEDEEKERRRKKKKSKKKKKEENERIKEEGKKILCQNASPFTINFEQADFPLLVTEGLKTLHRTVNEHQKHFLLNAVNRCATPLYVQLALSNAMHWLSSYDESTLKLQDEVPALIEELFHSLEAAHGKVLVSAALAYITAAKRGLSSTEVCLSLGSFFFC